jgi:indolepyruvate ferredoxin oxidoreductase
LQDALQQHVSSNHMTLLDATALTVAATGDAIGSNVFLLGAACQMGLLPVSIGSIERAIEINGVATSANLAALRAGRQAAVHALAATHSDVAPPAVTDRDSVSLLIEDRQRRLRDYGSPAYEQRYTALVNMVGTAERALSSGSVALTAAVARYFYKLLAVKDEYEVARLFTNGAFQSQLDTTFEGPVSPQFHFAPPLWASRDTRSGIPRKRTYGSWILIPLRILARARRLRGTLFDPFRWSADRRLECRLVDEYEHELRQLCGSLNESNLGVAVALATLPEEIRGFGYIKGASVTRVDAERARLRARLTGSN